jgi:hypothetical protein
MEIEAPEPEMGLTFEKVWTMFQATDRQFKATDQKFQATDQKFQETDRQFKAMSQEADKRHEKLERLMKKLTRNVGGVNHTLGRLMEAMYSARLWEKFAALGYGFTKGNQNTKFWENGQLIAAADIFLENGLYTMAVEVKADLDTDDVDDHLERLATIRGYMDNHEDKRILIGAVAGGIAPDNVVRYAQKKGLYVVCWSGNAATVLEAPPSFKVREWGAVLPITPP